MPPQIQHKRGTSSDIASVNPILLDGEIVFETDTKKFKFGDGSTSWNNLPYAVLPNSGVSISGINIISGSGNFNTLTVSSVPVSVSGHSHTSSNITNFNTAVSGLVSGIYQPLLTNPVTGVGTSGYLTRWNGPNSVTSGIIFDNGNRIGINTTSPSGLLDIAGDVYVRGTGNNLGTIYFKSASSTDTANRVRVDTNGNLFLDAGNAHIRVGNQDGRAEIKSGPAWVDIGHTYNAASSNQHIRFTPANTERVRITNVGDVGIGTTTPSGKLHVEGIGIFTSGIRLGSSSTSGTIIGLSTTDTVPAIIFDTVGNNHGNQQVIYDFRENGVSFVSIDGIGNLQANVGNIVAIASNPATDNGAFIGQGMRRRLLTNGLRFAWGESITSVSEPGIDLFPAAGTHISSGILFRLSKDSNKTDVAFIVDGSSRVGIGTSTPSGQLHVVGTGIVSSRLGVGITSPQYALDVVGSGNFLNGLAISGVPLGEIIDDEVAGLLVAGSGISLNYNDSANTLTVDTNVTTSLIAGTGISLVYNSTTDELSINTNLTSSNISNFNSSVSGLLPVTSILAGNNVSVATSGTAYIISSSGAGGGSSIKLGTIMALS